MGRAVFVISGVSTDGKYTIDIDSGEAIRVRLINALNSVLALIATRISLQSDKIVLADAREAEIQQQLADQIAVIVALQDAGQPEQAALASRIYSEFYLPKLATEKARNQPMRTALRKMKDEQKDATRKLNDLQVLVCKERRTAWCVTRTLAITNNPVRTLEIANEPNLVLIAANTAAPIVGDGTILTSVKDSALATLNARLDAKTASLATTNADIATAVAADATLKAELKNANDGYMAAPSALTLKAIDDAKRNLKANTERLSLLRLTKSSLELQIRNINAEIAIWIAKASSDTPVYGDGQLWSRELLSPEQVYFNAAILPGWQKDKPTYRWGTASNIDYDNDTMTVTLSDTPTSSAQRLNVNKVSTLSDVPVEYLTCNADAFADGDRVVVQFTGQSWDDPKVIGFVDNPKQCFTWPTVQMALTYSSTINNSTGTRSWVLETFIDSCGNLRAGIYALSMALASTAVHTMVASAPVFPTLTNVSGPFTLTVGGGTVGEIWTETSSAYNMTAQQGIGISRVPSGGSGTSISVQSGSVFFRISEFTAYVVGASLPAGSAGPNCEPLVPNVGDGAWTLEPGSNPPISSSNVDLVNFEGDFAGALSWLAGRGALPTITVTNGVRTIQYVPTSSGATSSGALNATGTVIWNKPP